jgi:hypothetical protein
MGGIRGSPRVAVRPAPARQLPERLRTATARRHLKPPARHTRSRRRLGATPRISYTHAHAAPYNERPVGRHDALDDVDGEHGSPRMHAKLMVEGVADSHSKCSHRNDAVVIKCDLGTTTDHLQSHFRPQKCCHTSLTIPERVDRGAPWTVAVLSLTPMRQALAPMSAMTVGLLRLPPRYCC